jgi:exodeoxyribonuclease VII large subunit
MQLLRLTSELERAGVSVVRDKRMQFTEKVAKLEALNPMSVLTRGFSAVYKDSKLLKSVSDVQKGDTVTVRMKDGTLKAKCTDVLENTKG